MYPNKQLSLCVAIHDVAPSTWPECLHLLHAMKAVAPIPMSWLVVPCYHGSTARSRSCEATLERLAGEGDELVLHGFTHQDTAPLDGSLRWRLLRTVYTQREGEFAALALDESRRRIEQGLAWFGEREWPVSGFVAPAWLLGDEAWTALREFSFMYTTTYARFHLLRQGLTLNAPALVYAARNRLRRTISPGVMSALAALRESAQLVRLALHPRDAHHPELVLHAQRLVERLLASREAVTKTEFAARFRLPDVPQQAGAKVAAPPYQ